MKAKKKATKKKPARKVKSRSRKKIATKTVSAAVERAVDNVQLAARRSNGGSIRHYAWRRDHYQTLHEFWPFYLHEHSSARNRLLHFVGSTLGLIIFAVALGLGNYLLVIPALVSGYAFAWFGHFFIEKNRPATFKYPLKSFISDWRMWYTMLTGRITAELKRFSIESRP
ncbi:MAG: hypothetical protein OHK0011_22410 [Turneriella sp.]